MNRKYQRHQSFNISGADQHQSQIELDLGDAMNELKSIDPNGWERWYDRVVPETAKYPEILEIVRARVSRLKERQVLQDFVNAQPASAQVLNGDIYRDALRRLETGKLPAGRA